MKTVGKINLEIYRCITEDITTDEVVITDERVQHIKERHLDSYRKIEGYLQKVLIDPDYILKDEKNQKTGIILKIIEENDTRFQMVLRVHTSSDPGDFKNSIISAWDISEARWRNYINNKKILYKKD